MSGNMLFIAIDRTTITIKLMLGCTIQPQHLLGK